MKITILQIRNTVNNAITKITANYCKNIIEIASLARLNICHISALIASVI